MRSVFIFLRDTDNEEVAQFLGRTCPAQRGPPWIWECDGDACLYINCNSEDFSDGEWEPELRASVVAALGGSPAVSVQADVSGRHPGDAEVRALLVQVLGRFSGVAIDEYTSHSWTLEEVLSNYEVEEHPFFDDEGS